MPRPRKNGSPESAGLALDYRYPDAKRKNIPLAGLTAQAEVRKEKKHVYSYNPHLPPVLRFDPAGGPDKLPELLQAAQQRPLTREETESLAEALRNQQPWLEWSGKREEQECAVDPVALHIHERVSAQAILKVAEREDIQRSLFADPEQSLREALRFYEHDIDWSNRMILGDSLAVMASLARREGLAGKVQMIYIDPPYGIKYASNFQSEIGRRDVKDREQDLTREPEMIKAYRDTWTLGVHSYLSYLRDRFYAAKELLADTGSIFVQISDDNLHLVREILDEVFKPTNFASLITVWKTSSATAELLATTSDYLLWYAKDIRQVKYLQLYTPKSFDEADSGAAEYKFIALETGELKPASACSEAELNQGKRYRPSPTTSQSGSDKSRGPIPLFGKEYIPGPGGWKTNVGGFARLERAERLLPRDRSFSYIRLLDDFSVVPRSNLWTDARWGFDAADKRYVVETNPQVIQRCLLMTTDPGDLVLDPTCGSGTTAYVAEEWGRRWITIDTSRVALALARQRLLVAEFDYYKLRPTSAEDVARNPNGPWLRDPTSEIEGTCTLDCKTVPHVTLKSIAQNQALDTIFDKWQPILDERLKALNAALAAANTPELRAALRAKLQAKVKAEGKRAVTDADERRWILPPDLPRRADYTTVAKDFAGWYEWEVPFDIDPDWPAPLSEALAAFRVAWGGKMDEVNDAISARADQEELVDDPVVIRGVTRVSGPFTVEGVIPAEENIDFDQPSPIDELDEELESFAGEEADTAGADLKKDEVNAETYVEKMIRYLRADGVRFPDNKVVKFTRLELANRDGLQAEGEWENDGREEHVAVVLGPQYGPLTQGMVEDAMRTAYRRGYDALVFAAFSFDGEAQAVIQDETSSRMRLHMAQIRPDVNMGDLLKTTSASQLFTVSGAPRVSLRSLPSSEYEIEMEGVDIYDPVENVVRSAGKDKVAAWFIDSDYDGRTFCITQAFFPDKKAWEKLAKALNGKIEPEVFDRLNGSTSLPFAAGRHRRAAVKVIDPRGNEVMRVFRLAGAEGDNA